MPCSLAFIRSNKERVGCPALLPLTGGFSALNKALWTYLLANKSVRFHSTAPSISWAVTTENPSVMPWLENMKARIHFLSHLSRKPFPYIFFFLFKSTRSCEIRSLAVTAVPVPIRCCFSFLGNSCLNCTWYFSNGHNSILQSHLHHANITFGRAPRDSCAAYSAPEDIALSFSCALKALWHGNSVLH